MAYKCAVYTSLIKIVLAAVEKIVKSILNNGRVRSENKMFTNVWVLEHKASCYLLGSRPISLGT